MYKLRNNLPDKANDQHTEKKTCHVIQNPASIILNCFGSRQHLNISVNSTSCDTISFML